MVFLEVLDGVAACFDVEVVVKVEVFVVVEVEAEGGIGFILIVCTGVLLGTLILLALPLVLLPVLGVSNSCLFFLYLASFEGTGESFLLPVLEYIFLSFSLGKICILGAFGTGGSFLD